MASTPRIAVIGSANADLIGYGPGSGVSTWTVTPAWKLGGVMSVRIDFSVSARMPLNASVRSSPASVLS